VVVRRPDDSHVYLLDDYRNKVASAPVRYNYTNFTSCITALYDYYGDGFCGTSSAGRALDIAGFSDLDHAYTTTPSSALRADIYKWAQEQWGAIPTTQGMPDAKGTETLWNTDIYTIQQHTNKAIARSSRATNTMISVPYAYLFLGCFEGLGGQEPDSEAKTGSTARLRGITLSEHMQEFRDTNLVMGSFHIHILGLMKKANIAILVPTINPTRNNRSIIDFVINRDYTVVGAFSRYNDDTTPRRFTTTRPTWMDTSPDAVSVAMYNHIFNMPAYPRGANHWMSFKLEQLQQ
jgi:hypothetical protein